MLRSSVGCSPGLNLADQAGSGSFSLGPHKAPETGCRDGALASLFACDVAAEDEAEFKYGTDLTRIRL